MKANIKILGDYMTELYKMGKHQFFTSVKWGFRKLNKYTQVFFSAEDVYIEQDGKRIQLSNDELQEIINIYIGRMKQNKKINRKVNDIKEDNPMMDIYDAIHEAERNLNLK